MVDGLESEERELTFLRSPAPPAPDLPPPAPASARHLGAMSGLCDRSSSSYTRHAIFQVRGRSFHRLRGKSGRSPRAGGTSSAAPRPLFYYFEEAHGGSLTADSYGPAPYVQEVRRRALRQPVTQLSAGAHWGAEDTGQLCSVARRDRLCPHCAGLGGPGGIESVHHILFECPLYAEASARYPQLCFAGPLLADCYTHPSRILLLPTPAALGPLCC